MKISAIAILALSASSSAYVIPNVGTEKAVEAREPVSLDFSPANTTVAN